jgi:hypothetical protein
MMVQINLFRLKYVIFTYNLNHKTKTSDVEL